MLDAELFALLDREIGSQWGAASRHEAALAPARSERIASGGSAGAGPLSEELKVRRRRPTAPPARVRWLGRGRGGRLRVAC